MYIYLIGFTISCLLIGVAQKQIFSKQLFFLLSSVAIIIPCIIAALRSDVIGTDTSVYLRNLYTAAIESTSYKGYMNSSWFSIYRIKYVYEYEYGFTFLIYIFSKLFHSIHVVEFAVSSMIISLVYIGVIRYKSKSGLWLSMLVFYLLFYNTTLNMMRQWCAMAILIYSFKHLVACEKKYLIYTMIALLFHITAVFGIFFYIIYNYIITNKVQGINQGGNNKRIKYYFKINKFKISVNKIIVILLVICSLAMVILVGYMSPFLKFLGLTKYISYITGTYKFVPNQIILRLPILLLVWIVRKKTLINKDIFLFFATMLMLDLVFSQLAGITENSWRISVYFSIYNILFLPVICDSTIFRGSKLIFKFFLIMYLLIYWYYYFVLIGSHATIPYVPYWN